jgi:hypothetical protein
MPELTFSWDEDAAEIFAVVSRRGYTVSLDISPEDVRKGVLRWVREARDLKGQRPSGVLPFPHPKEIGGKVIGYGKDNAAPWSRFRAAGPAFDVPAAF